MNQTRRGASLLQFTKSFRTQVGEGIKEAIEKGYISKADDVWVTSKVTTTSTDKGWSVDFDCKRLVGLTLIKPNP